MIQEKAKLIVSDKVFSKIKYLCNRFHKVEWSGLIWMDIQGSVEDPANLKINIIDFTLFDIGSGAYTEFEVAPEIILPIYEKYPEYIEKKYGCIHSHNNMSVFFSGTDTSTLLEQAFIHNFFVSLIVNNNFDKIAKISYKGEKEVKETFYNRIGKIILPYNRHIKEEVVYIIECEVEYENDIPVDDELLEQINILNKKEEQKVAKRQHSYKGKSYKSFHHWEDMGDNFGNQGKQIDLFAEEKVATAHVTFNQKCEDFIKRLMCVDYTGEETIKMSLSEAREDRDTYYGGSPRKDYIEEVREFCDDLLDEVFKKELEANWYEYEKFQKLRMMLSSQFAKLLDVSIPIEKDILEITDLKLKELEDERLAGII